MGHVARSAALQRAHHPHRRQRHSKRELTQPLGEFLREHGFGSAFCDWYFLPMMACIWSCPTAQMLQFPVATMMRFCHNHGLLQITNRPQWWTVQGGAKHYVEKITAQVLTDKRLNTPVRRIARAAAPDRQQPVRITPTQASRTLRQSHHRHPLGPGPGPAGCTHRAGARHAGRHSLPAQPAVLHTDTSVLPKRQRAWAAWNYERAARRSQQEEPRVCLHYLLNRLQPLPWAQPVLVSLNPVRRHRPGQVHGVVRLRPPGV